MRPFVQSVLDEVNTNARAKALLASTGSFASAQQQQPYKEVTFEAWAQDVDFKDDFWKSVKGAIVDVSGRRIVLRQRGVTSAYAALRCIAMPMPHRPDTSQSGPPPPVTHRRASPQRAASSQQTPTLQFGPPSFSSHCLSLSHARRRLRTGSPRRASRLDRLTVPFNTQHWARRVRLAPHL